MAKPLPKSHYVGPGAAQAIVSRTLSVLVDNEPGVLARVIGLFSGRGYNIDSLTVTETEHEKHLSRITIVTSGTPDVIEQIKHQLERLVPVHRVRDLTVEADALERELALIKVVGQGRKAHRSPAHRRDLPRPGGRHLDRAFRVRADRQAVKARAVHSDHDRARPRRSVADRHRRHWPRSLERLKELPEFTAGPSCMPVPPEPPAASAATPQPHKYDREEQRKPCAFITIVMPTSISSRPRRSRSSATAARVTRTR